MAQHRLSPKTGRDVLSRRSPGRSNASACPAHPTELRRRCQVRLCPLLAGAHYWLLRQAGQGLLARRQADIDVEDRRIAHSRRNVRLQVE